MLIKAISLQSQFITSTKKKKIMKIVMSVILPNKKLREIYLVVQLYMFNAFNYF